MNNSGIINRMKLEEELKQESEQLNDSKIRKAMLPIISRRDDSYENDDGDYSYVDSNKSSTDRNKIKGGFEDRIFNTTDEDI